MLHGLGSRRTRVLNQPSSNSQEIEKENAPKSSDIAARKSSRVQRKAASEKNAKKHSQASKTQDNAGGECGLGLGAAYWVQLWVQERSLA